MFETNILLGLSLLLFLIGLTGAIIRRNLLVMLMCMELMLNAVILALVVLSSLWGNTAGTVLSFLIYLIAASEMAIAIPIIVHLVRSKKSLDAALFSDLKG